MRAMWGGGGEVRVSRVSLSGPLSGGPHTERGTGERGCLGVERGDWGGVMSFVPVFL